jgi:hypothetical protein
VAHEGERGKWLKASTVSGSFHHEIDCASDEDRPGGVLRYDIMPRGER